MPPHCPRPATHYFNLRGRPLHPQLLCPPGHEQLLAQGREKDHQRLILDPNLHLLLKGLPPPIISYCRSKRRLAALRVACPPHKQPGHNKTPCSPPLPIGLDGPRLLSTPYQRSLIGLPPPGLAESPSVPPYQEAPTYRCLSAPHTPSTGRPNMLPSCPPRPNPRQEQHPPPSTHGTHLPRPANQSHGHAT